MPADPPSAPPPIPPPDLPPAGPAATTVRGMGFMVGSALAGVVMASLVRHASAELHPFVIGFFRSLLTGAILLPVLVRSGLAPLRTRRPWGHVGRSTLGAISMLLSYYALATVPIAKVTAIQFSGPLFATVLAVLFLGEAIRLRRTVALLVGFAGTLVILRPGVDAIEPGAWMALIATLIWGWAMMLIKRMSATESNVTQVLYVAIVFTPITLAAALPVWQTPTWAQLGWLVAIAASGVVTQLCFSQAFRDADVTATTPLEFTKLLWAGAIGYLAFGEVPDRWTWIGGAMIFGAVVYITLRERRLRRAALPPAGPAGGG